jgi:outer membrane biosynthesis protein TonB
MIAASLDAARLWKFSPARKNTQPIPSEMILRFEFKRPK